MASHSLDLLAAFAYLIRTVLIENRSTDVSIGFAHVLMPAQQALSAYYWLVLGVSRGGGLKGRAIRWRGVPRHRVGPSAVRLCGSRRTVERSVGRHPPHTSAPSLHLGRGARCHLLQRIANVTRTAADRRCPIFLKHHPVSPTTRAVLSPAKEQGSQCLWPYDHILNGVCSAHLPAERIRTRGLSSPART